MNNTKIKDDIVNYYKSYNLDYSRLPNEQKKKFSDSIISERIQRIGVEAKYFNVDVNDISTLTYIAISTLKHSALKRLAKKRKKYEKI